MKFNSSGFSEQLKDKLEKNQPFSFIRFPGEKDILEEGEVSFLPFNTLWKDRFSLDDGSAAQNIFFPSTEKEEYIRNLRNLISQLKQNNNKVVISRVIEGKISSEKFSELPNNIERLFEKNPNALVAVINTNSHGLWIFATPELLLKKVNGIFHTMALAGTRPSNTNREWDNKNLVEQRYVTDYICNKWINLGMDPIVEPSLTLSAGNVEHVCTPIKAQQNGVKFQDAIDIMNPTPAVCGTPKEFALEWIGKIEKHQRLLYSGVICVHFNDGLEVAYVILRCIHIKSDGQYNIFVGSGITRDSDAEDEWNETELKAKLLANIFN